MKIAIQMPLSHLLKLSIICLLAVTVFNSCEKDNSSKKEPVKGEAKVKFINASQNAQPVDFDINNTKINTSALAFGESSEYSKIESGTKTNKVNFFVKDKEERGDILTFEDNLGAIEAGKAKITYN